MAGRFISNNLIISLDWVGLLLLFTRHDWCSVADRARRLSVLFAPRAQDSLFQREFPQQHRTTTEKNLTTHSVTHPCPCPAHAHWFISQDNLHRKEHCEGNSVLSYMLLAPACSSVPFFFCVDDILSFLAHRLLQPHRPIASPFTLALLSIAFS